MRHAQHFANFITDTVNLNATRVDSLKDSVEAIKNTIRASDWGPKLKYFYPQGSWAHKTIIKPVDGKAFDADILAVVAPKDGWDPKQYIDELYKIFAAHGTYKDKSRRFSHCVTIEYAGERKIDIAPCVINRGGFSLAEVCNRVSNQFERSEPQKYTEWVEQQNKKTGSNGLKKITKLIKYLRDTKGTFSCQSVLLTTLLGSCIDSEDLNSSADFEDVPTALKTIVSRLDKWLQANQTMPTVRNPVLDSEIFSQSWNADKYDNFRSKIHLYRTWIDGAYGEIDSDESIDKWRQIFGEDFASGVTTQKISMINGDAVSVHLSESPVLARFAGDLVAAFTRFGTLALPRGFNRLSHKKRPPWSAAPMPEFSVEIVPTFHATKKGAEVPRAFGANEPLPKGYWLRFQFKTRSGAPLSQEFGVYWRVTNTDREASAANCLRGDIVESNDGTSHWEHLQYRGVHTVEALIVRKRNNVLVSQSNPFYVVIELKSASRIDFDEAQPPATRLDALQIYDNSKTVSFMAPRKANLATTPPPVDRLRA